MDKVFAEQPQDLNLDSSTHLKFRLGVRWREADPGTESAQTTSPGLRDAISKLRWRAIEEET